jgi:hypothetical protein
MCSEEPGPKTKLIIVGWQTTQYQKEAGLCSKKKRGKREAGLWLTLGLRQQKPARTELVEGCTPPYQIDGPYSIHDPYPGLGSGPKSAEEFPSPLRLDGLQSLQHGSPLIHAVRLQLQI